MTADTFDAATISLINPTNSVEADVDEQVKFIVPPMLPAKVV
jgi:hypothetical protein